MISLMVVEEMMFMFKGTSDQWSIKFKQNFEWVNSSPETITYTVTAALKSNPFWLSDNAYYIDGIEAPELTFKEGNTYIFDISDPSLNQHPFALSTGPDGSGSNYTDNVTGGNGTVTITVDDTTPNIYYYCEAHPGMGSSVEVSLINFGNFILSNGNDINILNDIETIQFDDKTIDLYGDDGGQVFTNTNNVDNFNGSWWEDYIDLSAGGSVTSGVTLDTSLGTVVDAFGNIDTFSSIETFGGTSFNDTFYWK